MKLFIRNMVAASCIKIVRQELKKLGLRYNSVVLGEADVIGEITPGQREQLQRALKKSGFEITDDHKTILTEKIKLLIIDMVHGYKVLPPGVSVSKYISQTLSHQKMYLSNLFSKITGTTIQQFLMLHKAEKVKKLLVENKLTAKEIAYKMNYSSTAHLSKQFKNTTGYTITEFLNSKDKKRKTLEKL